MSIDTLPASATTVQVDPMRRWVLYGVALLLMTLPFIVTADSSDNAGAAIAIALVVAPFVGMLIYVTRRTRLVLTPRGISYYNIGTSVETHWDNVRRLAVDDELCGLELKKRLDQPGMRRMQRYAAMSVGGSPYYSEQQQQLIAQQRYIDLRAYRRQLRNGDLAEMFAAYAPQLKILRSKT